MNLSLLTRGIFSAFFGTTEESITEVEVAESLTGAIETETELTALMEEEVFL